MHRIAASAVIYSCCGDSMSYKTQFTVHTINTQNCQTLWFSLATSGYIQHAQANE